MPERECAPAETVGVYLNWTARLPGSTNTIGARSTARGRLRSALARVREWTPEPRTARPTARAPAAGGSATTRVRQIAARGIGRDEPTLTLLAGNLCRLLDQTVPSRPVP